MIGQDKRLQWREGAVLKIEHTQAVIKMSRPEKIIEIKIQGRQKRELLAIIRNHFDHINGSMKKIKVVQEIPCNCTINCDRAWEYNDLIRLEGEGHSKLVCVRSGKTISISKLLDGYEKKEGRMEKFKESPKEDGIYMYFNQNQNVEQSNIQNQEVKQVVKIDIEVKVDLPAIQNDFAELRKAIASINPGLSDELNRIEDSLDEVTPQSDKEKLAKPMNKMRRFLENVSVENSDFHRAIKATKKRVEIAQKVGKTYNKFAQWLAIPQVPDLFLGK